MPRKSKGTRTNASHKPQEIPARFEPSFIAKLDGRTDLCRLLRERFDSIADDLGGVDDMSTIKTSLLERFLWLESALTNIEHSMATVADAKTTSGLLAQWIQGCNSLLGISKVLGIERQARKMDLKGYVEGKGNGKL